MEFNWISLILRAGAGMQGFISVLVVGLSLSLSAAAKEARIIALSDLHGQLEAKTTEWSDGSVHSGGGAALVASYVRALREGSRAPVFLVDAGDLFQGTFVSNSNEGKPVIHFYNHLKLDAVAIGNHEFDFGPVGPARVAAKPADDARGALKQRMREARFPFLSANIAYKSGQAVDWLRPSVLLERGGVKLGVIGVTTEGTPYQTVRANVADLAFSNAAESIRREARQLRERGADFVVAIVHEGDGCLENQPEKIDDLSSCRQERLFPVIAQVPKDLIDLVIGGHTHQVIAKRVGKVGVLQPGSKGLKIGWAELKTGSLPEVYEASVKVGKFLNQEMRPDPEVTALLQPYFDQVQEIVGQNLDVVAKAPFSRLFGDALESTIGNLFTDLSREGFGHRADIGIMNHTGLRAGLPRGPLKFGDAFEVLPFDDSLALLTLRGSQIRRLIEVLVTERKSGLAMSGVTYTAVNCEVKGIKVGGQELMDSATYKVMTTDFLGRGGGPVGRIGLQGRQVRIFDELPPVRDLFIAALKQAKRIDPAEHYDRDNPRQRMTGQCP